MFYSFEFNYVEKLFTDFLDFLSQKVILKKKKKEKRKLEDRNVEIMCTRNSRAQLRGVRDASR